MKKLSTKHLAFIDEYFKDFNGGRAYSAVYQVKNEATAKSAASRLLTNDLIIEEVNKRKAEIAKNSVKSKEELVKDLTKVVDLFLTSGFHTGQALKAIELISKLQGFYEPTKIEHSGDLNINLSIPGLEDKQEDDSSE